MGKWTVVPTGDLEHALRSLPGWSLEGGKLHRELTFPAFRDAFTFMAGVALLAERMNHHPEWSNIYNRVSVFLMTHDAGGITGLDLKFAEEAERIAQGLGAAKP